MGNIVSSTSARYPFVVSGGSGPAVSQDDPLDAVEPHNMNGSHQHKETNDVYMDEDPHDETSMTCSTLFTKRKNPLVGLGGHDQHQAATAAAAASSSNAWSICETKPKRHQTPLVYDSRGTVEDGPLAGGIQEVPVVSSSSSSLAVKNDESMLVTCTIPRTSSWSTMEPYTEQELNMDEGDLPTLESDLRPHKDYGCRHFHIVTTAALPWFTGTSINPLLRAGYFSQMNRPYAPTITSTVTTTRIETRRDENGNEEQVEVTENNVVERKQSTVTLVVPWLQDEKDRVKLYGEAWRTKTRVEQEECIREWLRDAAGMPLEAASEEEGGIGIIWYAAKYHPSFASIFAMGDICANLPDTPACDVCFLEEPEHLNWYKASHSHSWTDRFHHVVGIGHTNYLAYSVKSAAVLATPGLQMYSSWMVRAYCHKLIKLSGVLQTYAPEKEVICNVHGIRSDFLLAGPQADQQEELQQAQSNYSSTTNATIQADNDGEADEMTGLMEELNFVSTAPMDEMMTTDYEDVVADDLLLGRGAMEDIADDNASEHPEYSQENQLEEASPLTPEGDSEESEHRTEEGKNAMNDTLREELSTSPGNRGLTNSADLPGQEAESIEVQQGAESQSEPKPDQSDEESTTVKENLMSVPSQEQPKKELSGVYFLGKLLWAKGLDQLIELENYYKKQTGSYFEIDIVGSGPDQEEIERAFRGGRGIRQVVVTSESSQSLLERNSPSKATTKNADSLQSKSTEEVESSEARGQSSADISSSSSSNLLTPVLKGPGGLIIRSNTKLDLPKSRHEFRKTPIPAKFLGRQDHLNACGDKYKIFVNPSLSEVLCTATAEAIAMGKFVIVPVHPSNDFFAQFPNCLQYRTRKEFVHYMQYALAHTPPILTKEQTYPLTWEAATERCLVAAQISRRDAKRWDRIGKTKQDAMLKRWHNALMGSKTRGNLFRAVIGAGPVADQYVESDDQEGEEKMKEDAEEPSVDEGPSELVDASALD